MADERKAVARKSRTTGKTPAAEPQERVPAAKAPRPEDCRRYALERVAEAMPELIEALVEHSRKGSLGHMKLVVQIGGLDEPLAAETAQPGRDVAAELIEEWTGEEDEPG